MLDCFDLKKTGYRNFAVQKKRRKKNVSSNPPRTLNLLHFFEALFAFNVIFTTNILMSAMSSAVRMAANMSMKVRVDTFASTLRVCDFTNLVFYLIFGGRFFVPRPFSPAACACVKSALARGANQRLVCT